MSDSERYMLIFALTIFFGMMALGLVIIHSNNQTQKHMDNLVLQQTLATSGNAECYSKTQYQELIFELEQQKNLKHFMRSRLTSNKALDIYIDTSPDGQGAFLITTTTEKTNNVEEGCIITAGSNKEFITSLP